ncbi:MFS transporter [Sedimentibacter hydroxybenzoicus DSM 7310]|uniref:MFS transporter n=1 Tax=Sedimentibacter hydroxybenzoicus DSM 7310 TaxID=1123245 RepID=A0A974GVR3_SEDHY|nr:MFS transporter [Sedimentibacter hydroxybenzoicus]NYB73581.1 MFS transporter [Sedimentibacter hydroxybenzoicus DSM 7310]
MNSKLKRNISIGYVYNFFLQLNMTSAIWVLYLAFRGMSLIEIGILESIYHITGLILEIPSGAIADLYGRKFSVVAGRVVNLISCILMITANSFLEFAISFILSSAAMNLNSGAAEALIYDSLKESGEEGKYKKIWGQTAFIMSISQGIAILLGGILADVKFLYAYVFGAIVQIIALMVSLNFTEPTVNRKHNIGNLKKEKENIFVNQLKISIDILKCRKIVLYIIMFSALLGSLQTTVFFYSQKFFSDMGYTKTIIAVICFIGSIVEAYSSKYAYKIEKRLNIREILISLSALNVIALAGLAFVAEFSIGFYLLTNLTGGLAFTILSDYINGRIPSESRATILSFESLWFSIFMIGVFPLFGFIAEKIGLTLTFGIIALVYIPAIIFLILKLQKHEQLT